MSATPLPPRGDYGWDALAQAEFDDGIEFGEPTVPPLTPEQKLLLQTLPDLAPAQAPEASRAALPLEPLELAALLAGDPPEVRWLWQGWLARGDLALIVADPKVGKSLLALGLATAARNGGSFLEADCPQVRVGVFDYENPLDECHKRLRCFSVTAADHDGLCYFHMPPLDLQREEGQAALAAAIELHRLELVVIDSLRRAAPGVEENDSASVSAVFSPLRTLSATTGCTIVVVHHARKRIGDNPTEAAQMVRGSGDLVASIDTLLYLRAKEGGSFTLEHAASRRALPHEPILVEIQGDETTIELVNAGPVAAADDKVEALLARIVEALRDDGGTLERQVLALRVDKATTDGTFSRALRLGWQRELLAKTKGNVGEPTLYALADGVAP